ncbi:MAG: flippase-like domain-containing protein [Nitrospiraceae bacterium]
MWLRLSLLAVGTLVLSILVWQIGIDAVIAAATTVGPVGLVLALLPSLAMYVAEAYGWKLTLGAYARAVSFVRLFAIRTAGEVVNMTTPSAYVGGEPLKAYLLKRDGVPMVDGLASVVLAKTVMTVAQVVFILVGIALTFWLVGSERSMAQMVMASLVSAGLLSFGLVGLVMVQRWGLFAGGLRLLRRCGVQVAALNAREAQLQALDETIQGFYRTDRVKGMLSTGCFLVGWLCEAVEVWAMLAVMGRPIGVGASLAIGGVSSMIKGGTFFIPGSLGAQDAGNVMLLSAFGYDDVTGLAFALLRRFREITWIVIGLLCLALLGGRQAVTDSATTSSTIPSGA